MSFQKTQLKTERVYLYDAPAYTKAVYKGLNILGVEITESVFLSLIRKRYIFEQVSLQESISKSLLKTTIINNNLQLSENTDYVVNSSTIIKVISDSVEVREFSKKHLCIFFQFPSNETEEIHDLNSRWLRINRSSAEEEQIVDNVSYVINSSTIIKELQSTVEVSETSAIYRYKPRYINDSVNITEFVDKVVNSSTIIKDPLETVEIQTSVDIVINSSTITKDPLSVINILEEGHRSIKRWRFTLETVEIRESSYITTKSYKYGLPRFVSTALNLQPRNTPVLTTNGLGYIVDNNKAYLRVLDKYEYEVSGGFREHSVLGTVENPLKDFTLNFGVLSDVTGSQKEMGIEIELVNGEYIDINSLSVFFWNDMTCKFY